MIDHTNPEYLATEEYEDAADLNQRTQIQQEFGINSYPWFQWVFDQFDLPPRSQILELGCGSGSLWTDQEHRLAEKWTIILSDLSPGMLQEASHNLGGKIPLFAFVGVETQSIPFKDNHFDAVVAIGLFDHVADLAKAFREVHRVLKPGGQLYASAGGCNHLREIKERVKPFIPDENLGGMPDSFGLENGLTQLSEWFEPVTLHPFRDTLVFKEVEPIRAYVFSEAKVEAALVGQKQQEFSRSLQEELALNGEIRVTIDKGLFKAYKWKEERRH